MVPVRTREEFLALTLRDRSYEWRFLPASGADFADSGRGRCS